MKKILTTPIRDVDLADLRVGDIVHLNGTVVTGRDDVHHRVVVEKIPAPMDLQGLALFHAGPIVREEPDNNQLVSIGPTSSIRMEEYAADFIALTGIKMMIGKGGMGPKTSEACRRHKVVHCVSPGGCAVLTASQVEKIENVYWRELGMPECMWVMRVRELGPLIVAIDTLGNNMFLDNKKYYASRQDECMAPIIAGVGNYMNIEVK